MRRRSSEASNKGSDGEDSDKKFNHSKESDECKPKNNSTLNWMSAEQTQNFIADVVKAHIGGNSHKTNLY